MNHTFYGEVSEAIEKRGPAAGLRVYERYLNQRNASYLQLEGGGTSAFANESPDWDPFAAVTGYHRIAVDTIQGLCGARPGSVVLNIPNGNALGGLAESDVVEVNCRLDGAGVHPMEQTPIPSEVFGLIESTKAYERSMVSAAIEQDSRQMVWALTQHPLVGDWDEAAALVGALVEPA